MAEYIKREALIADIDAAMDNDGMGRVVGQTLKRYVKRQPVADVAPVVRGRWKPIKRKNLWGDEVDALECSACKKSDVKGRAVVRWPDFCPNCGADMREG